MGKIINDYGGFTATAIAAKASNTCNMTVLGTTVDCTNIQISKIKNVIGHYNADLGSLCNSSNVNKWSGFSPLEWYASASQVLSRVKTPYEMGSFAGYNHNAAPASLGLNNSITLNSSYSNSNFNLSVDLQLSEVNWSALDFDNWLITVDNVIASTGLLSSVNGNLINAVIPLTAPYAGANKTYSIKLWFGLSDIHTTAQLVEVANSTTINVKVAAAYANHLISDSAANRNVVNASGLIDEATEYVYRLDLVSTNKYLSIAGNSLSGTYYITADIKRISDNAFLRTEIIPHRLFRTNVYMYKINGSNQSTDYLVASNVWIENVSGSDNYTYTIPVVINPVDEDMFYLKFDNLYQL